MPKIIDKNKVREDFMNATINVVSTFGLEGATTKAIAAESGINESYIYRFFIDREDLLLRTFLRTDREFCNLLSSNLYVMFDYSKEFKDRLHQYFDMFWNYLKINPAKAKFFFRYYYSSMFYNNGYQEHKDIVKEIYLKFSEFIKKDNRIDMVFYLIYMSLLSLIITQDEFQNDVLIANDEVVFETIAMILLPYVDDQKLEQLGEIDL